MEECQNCNFIEIPFAQLAKDLGGAIYENIIAFGVICGILEMDSIILHDLLTEHFERLGADILANNLNAVDLGIKTSQDAINAGNLVRKYNLETDAAVRSDLMLDGRLALCFGIIAGGCNYMTWYPMAPSTNLGMFLSSKSGRIFDDQRSIRR